MKYLTIISLAASFFILSPAAFAKTEGSYLTAEAIRTHLRYYKRYYNNTDYAGIRTRPSHTGTDNYGGGLSYKYAFNLNGLYFAPGIFYEKHDASVNGYNPQDGYNFQRMEISNRYGLKSDIGFDIGHFSPYITGGYSAITYRTINYHTIGINTMGVTTEVAHDFFYGGGFKFEIPRTALSLNLEYNVNSFAAKTKVAPGHSENPHYEFRTKFDIFKIGLSYNF
jgi:hypothetical protein